VAGSNTLPGGAPNPGTNLATPRRDFDTNMVNSLPAGSRLLFRRGGAWNWSTVRLNSQLSSVGNPYYFDAYGIGTDPLLRVASANPAQTPNFGFEFSTWGGTVVHGGYEFRNLKFDGMGSGSNAFFLRGAVSGVVIDTVTITGFAIGINSQGNGPIRNITLRNSRIVRNTSMGMLGAYNDSLIEGNLFEENNYISGHGLNHGSYLSGHGNGVSNVIIRNNHYRRNSVVDGSGKCTGGNMTFHGRMDNVLIEGNTIEQDAGYTTASDIPASGCWLMSITQGYNISQGVESFTNFVVRNNRFINGGNTAMAVTSAPNVLIEDNVFINQQSTAQTAINVGNHEYDSLTNTYNDGDALDVAPVVRNNRACYHQSPNVNSRVVQFHGPVAATPVDPSNTMVQSSAGTCARN
jgi:hypothetical protein